MRILFFVFSLLLISETITAQVGFNAGYFSQQVPEWEAAVFGTRSSNSLLSSGYAAEIDYRFASFENLRIEFYPSLGFNRSNSSYTLDSLSYKDFKLDQYEFNLKTNIYFLSLKADCDCPTFSRESGILKKGLFLQIAPGISYFRSSLESPAVNADANGFNFKLGVGLGLEIGVTDYITITPIVKYNHYFNVEWEGLQNSIATIDNREVLEGGDITKISQFYGGIRLGFRLQR
jgi:opacity protein-like surface antigen